MSEAIRRDVYNLKALTVSEGWKLVYKELTDRIAMAQHRLENCQPEELFGLQAQIAEDRFLVDFPERRKFELEETGGGADAQDSES